MMPDLEIANFIQSMLIIGFILGGVLMILGGRGVGRFLFMVVIFLMLFPILWSVAPPWVSLIIFAFIGLSFLQVVLSLLLGRRTAESVTASLATSLVRFLLMILILPLRIVQRMIGMVTKGN